MISEPPSCLVVSIIGMCYGKEDGKRNKQKHTYKSVAFLFRFSSPFPEHIPIIETTKQDGGSETLKCR